MHSSSSTFQNHWIKNGYPLWKVECVLSKIMKGTYKAWTSIDKGIINIADKLPCVYKKQKNNQAQNQVLAIPSHLSLLIFRFQLNLRKNSVFEESVNAVLKHMITEVSLTNTWGLVLYSDMASWLCPSYKHWW